MEKLEELGVKVLHNTNTQIPSSKTHEESICFVGTDDLEADRIG